MPSLNFVMPHWLYWSGLIVFPLVAMWLVARQERNGAPRGTSLFIAYMFWLTAGFLGIHRVYLKSLWALPFIGVFVAILVVNGDIRDAREDVSRTHAASEKAQLDVRQGRGSPAQVAATDKEATAAAAELDHWRAVSRGLALGMAAMLLIDAALIPGTVRRLRAREADVVTTQAEPVIVEGPPPETRRSACSCLGSRRSSGSTCSPAPSSPTGR